MANCTGVGFIGVVGVRPAVLQPGEAALPHGDEAPASLAEYLFHHGLVDEKGLLTEGVVDGLVAEALPKAERLKDAGDERDLEEIAESLILEPLSEEEFAAIENYPVRITATEGDVEPIETTLGELVWFFGSDELIHRTAFPQGLFSVSGGLVRSFYVQSRTSALLEKICPDDQWKVFLRDPWERLFDVDLVSFLDPQSKRPALHKIQKWTPTALRLFAGYKRQLQMEDEGPLEEVDAKFIRNSKILCEFAAGTLDFSTAFFLTTVGNGEESTVDIKFSIKSGHMFTVGSVIIPLRGPMAGHFVPMEGSRRGGAAQALLDYNQRWIREDTEQPNVMVLPRVASWKTLGFSPAPGETFCLSKAAFDEAELYGRTQAVGRCFKGHHYPFEMIAYVLAMDEIYPDFVEHLSRVVCQTERPSDPFYAALHSILSRRDATIEEVRALLQITAMQSDAPIEEGRWLLAFDDDRLPLSVPVTDVALEDLLGDLSEATLGRILSNYSALRQKLFPLLSARRLASIWADACEQKPKLTGEAAQAFLVEAMDRFDQTSEGAMIALNMMARGRDAGLFDPNPVVLAQVLKAFLAKFWTPLEKGRSLESLVPFVVQSVSRFKSSPVWVKVEMDLFRKLRDTIPDLIERMLTPMLSVLFEENHKRARKFLQEESVVSTELIHAWLAIALPFEEKNKKKVKLVGCAVEALHAGDQASDIPFLWIQLAEHLVELNQPEMVKNLVNLLFGPNAPLQNGGDLAAEGRILDLTLKVLAAGQMKTGYSQQLLDRWAELDGGTDYILTLVNELYLASQLPGKLISENEELFLGLIPKLVEPPVVRTVWGTIDRGSLSEYSTYKAGLERRLEIAVDDKKWTYVHELCRRLIACDPNSDKVEPSLRECIRQDLLAGKLRDALQRIKSDAYQNCAFKRSIHREILLSIQEKKREKRLGKLVARELHDWRVDPKEMEEDAEMIRLLLPFLDDAEVSRELLERFSSLFPEEMAGSLWLAAIPDLARFNQGQLLEFVERYLAFPPSEAESEELACIAEGIGCLTLRYHFIRKVNERLASSRKIELLQALMEESAKYNHPVAADLLTSVAPNIAKDYLYKLTLACLRICEVRLEHGGEDPEWFLNQAIEGISLYTLWFKSDLKSAELALFRIALSAQIQPTEKLANLIGALQLFFTHYELEEHPPPAVLIPNLQLAFSYLLQRACKEWDAEDPASQVYLERILAGAVSWNHHCLMDFKRATLIVKKVDEVCGGVPRPQLAEAMIRVACAYVPDRMITIEECFEFSSALMPFLARVEMESGSPDGVKIDVPTTMVNTMLNALYGTKPSRSAGSTTEDWLSPATWLQQAIHVLRQLQVETDQTRIFIGIHLAIQKIVSLPYCGYPPRRFGLDSLVLELMAEMGEVPGRLEDADAQQGAKAVLALMLFHLVQIFVLTDSHIQTEAQELFGLLLGEEPVDELSRPEAVVQLVRLTCPMVMHAPLTEALYFWIDAFRPFLQQGSPREEWEACFAELPNWLEAAVIPERSPVYEGDRAKTLSFIRLLKRFRDDKEGHLLTEEGNGYTSTHRELFGYLEGPQLLPTAPVFLFELLDHMQWPQTTRTVQRISCWVTSLTLDWLRRQGVIAWQVYRLEQVLLHMAVIAAHVHLGPTPIGADFQNLLEEPPEGLEEAISMECKLTLMFLLGRQIPHSEWRADAALPSAWFNAMDHFFAFHEKQTEPLLCFSYLESVLSVLQHGAIIDELAESVPAATGRIKRLIDQMVVVHNRIADLTETGLSPEFEGRFFSNFHKVLTEKLLPHLPSDNDLLQYWADSLSFTKMIPLGHNDPRNYFDLPTID